MMGRRRRPTDGPDDDGPTPEDAVCEACIKRNVALNFMAQAICRVGAGLAVSKELRKILIHVGDAGNDTEAAEIAMNMVCLAERRNLK